MRPNAATAAMDRVQAAFEARDWVAMRAACTPDANFDDRRRIAQVCGDADWWVAGMQGVVEAPDLRYQRTLVRTCGDHVDLERVLWTGGPPRGRFDVEQLWLTEVDEHGRIVFAAAFDVDDVQAANREAWTRWFAVDATAAAALRPQLEFIEAWNSHDRARVRALLADDVVMDDHRRAVHDRAEGADALLEIATALWELAPDIHIDLRALSVLAHEPYGSVTTGRDVGTFPDGGAFERYRIVLTTVARGRITRHEFFELDDLDKALARLEDLRPEPLRIPPNAATRANERSYKFIAARDWPAYRALTSADFTFDDRRKRSLVSGDIELFIKNLEVVNSWQVSRRTIEPVATVGDRIALDRLAFAGNRDGSTFEGEFLRLTEIDADGQLRAVMHFDPDDRRAAFDEAQARFVNGEATGCHAQALIQAFGGAIAGHDWDGLRKFFVDGLVLCDRRKLSFGEIPCGKLIESLHVLSDLGPDVGGELLQILEWNDYGRVQVIRQFGTTREGGAFETIFVPVLVVRDDHIVAYEIFDVGDADHAVARFRELCTDLAGSA
jgi:ketosteroid isomerase-like protein